MGKPTLILENTIKWKQKKAILEIKEQVTTSVALSGLDASLGAKKFIFLFNP